MHPFVLILFQLTISGLKYAAKKLVNIGKGRQSDICLVTSAQLLTLDLIRVQVIVRDGLGRSFQHRRDVILGLDVRGYSGRKFAREGVLLHIALEYLR